MLDQTYALAYRSGMHEKTYARARARVLVADDDRSVRMLVAHHFRDRPWETVFVEDADQAAAAYADGGFDVVLLDLEMPGGGGEAALAAMRASGGPGGRTVFLALSAHVGDEGFVLPRGFDGALAKPFDAEGLLAAVRGRLPASGGKRATDPTLARLATQALADLARGAETAAQALEAGDAAGAAGRAHAMRGAAGCYGFRDLEAAAEGLERCARDGDIPGARAALVRLRALLPSGSDPGRPAS